MFPTYRDYVRQCLRVAYKELLASKEAHEDEGLAILSRIAMQAVCGIATIDLGQIPEDWVLACWTGNIPN